LELRLSALGRFRDLAEVFLDAGARASDPKDAASFFRQAGFLFRDKADDAVAAVRAFRKALGVDPDDLESLTAADALLVARGDHAMRAELFRERAALRPEDSAARDGLVASLAAAGAWSELESIL